jgi:hypothetical protein
MKITDQVKSIVNNSNITSSQFYNDYQTLMSKYNLLIEKGIVDKRQSQLCSISDKLQLVSLNCNYYRSDKK